MELPKFVNKWLCQNEFYFSYSLNEDENLCFVKEGDADGDIDFSTHHDKIYMSYGVFADGKYFFPEIHSEHRRGEPYCLFTMYVPDTEEEFLQLIHKGLTKEYKGRIERLNP